MKLIETSITQCFVSPNICKQLMEAGLTAFVPFQWKVYGDFAKLVTDAFDFDDYYRQGQRHNDYLNPPDMTLPAYNIKDCEKLLPKDYFLMFNSECEYVVAPSNLYPIEGCTSERFPDAFALLLLECIEKRCIDLQMLNMILNQ